MAEEQTKTGQRLFTMYNCEHFGHAHVLIHNIGSQVGLGTWPITRPLLIVVHTISQPPQVVVVCF